MTVFLDITYFACAFLCVSWESSFTMTNIHTSFVAAWSAIDIFGKLGADPLRKDTELAHPCERRAIFYYGNIYYINIHVDILKFI